MFYVFYFILGLMFFLCLTFSYFYVLCNLNLLIFFIFFLTKLRSPVQNVFIKATESYLTWKKISSANILSVKFLHVVFCEHKLLHMWGEQSGAMWGHNISCCAKDPLRGDTCCGAGEIFHCHMSQGWLWLHHFWLEGHCRIWGQWFSAVLS